MPRTNCPLAQGVRMTRGETIFAWVYYPFYLLLTPLLIQLVFVLAGWTYDIYTLNLVFFYVNFLLWSSAAAAFWPSRCGRRSCCGWCWAC